MQRTPVESSQLKSIGFEDGVMEIEFRPKGVGQPADAQGPVYRYTGELVQTHYQNLMQQHADPDGSIGAYFGKNVRNCPVTTCVRVADL